MVVRAGLTGLSLTTTPLVSSSPHPRSLPYQAMVAFSSEHEYGGSIVKEVSLNDFRGVLIPKMSRSDPYRFLIVADKFQPITTQRSYTRSLWIISRQSQLQEMAE